METVHEEMTKGFTQATEKMTKEILARTPESGIMGACTVVVSMDEKNTVNAVCGILVAECEEEEKGDLLHKLHHTLQLLDDAQTALKEKAVEVYREILEIKTGALDEARGRGH